MQRYSILQLLVLVTAIAVVLALVVIPLQRAREHARQMGCSTQLKQVALALHNYHSAYNHFPAAMTGNANSASRLSGLIWLTPYSEARHYWETISTPSSFNGLAYPPMGPSPQDENFPPWRTQLRVLQCPSDPSWDGSNERVLKTLAKTNFAFSVGDRIANLYQCQGLDEVRGAFAPNQNTRLKDVTDGASHTVCLAEIATEHGRHLQGQFSIGHPSSLADDPGSCFLSRDPARWLFYDSKQELSELGRGGAFADGSGGFSLVHTILPPNAPSCAIGKTEPYSGIFSAGSYHPGGCHIVLVDGAVRFISDTIDIGDPNRLKPSPRRVFASGGDTIASPYGVWGALGSRAGNETETSY